MDQEEDDSVSSLLLPDLPSEIICFQILPRLPGKSLVRFKSVCKSWFSLISGRHDPLFLCNHRNFHLNMSYTYIMFDVFDKIRGLEHLLVVQLNQDCTSTSPLSATRLLTLPYKRRLRFGYQYTNGLVCFCLFDETFLQKPFPSDGCFHIFNPCTRESITVLPPAPYHEIGLKIEHDLSSGLRFVRDPFRNQLEVVPNDLLVPWLSCQTEKFEYYFGYSPRTNEYKVMELRWYSLRSSPGRWAINIMTLGTTNTWRQIEVLNNNDVVDLLSVPNWPSRCLCINGTLHWLRFDYNVLAFDLGDERFKAIPYPDPETSRYKRSTLVEVDGFLALAYEKESRGKAMELWILKDYKKQTWVKETIVYPSFSFSYQSFVFGQPSVRSGELMIQYLHPQKFSLQLYNRESKTLRTREIILPEEITPESTRWSLFTSYDENIVPLKIMKNECKRWSSDSWVD